MHIQRQISLTLPKTYILDITLCEVDWEVQKVETMFAYIDRERQA